MIRELQILDRELSKANNVTFIRKDFTMYERNFLNDSTSFLKEVEKSAKKEKTNHVTLISISKD